MKTPVQGQRCRVPLIFRDGAAAIATDDSSWVPAHADEIRIGERDQTDRAEVALTLDDQEQLGFVEKLLFGELS